MANTLNFLQGFVWVRSRCGSSSLLPEVNVRRGLLVRQPWPSCSDFTGLECCLLSAGCQSAPSTFQLQFCRHSLQQEFLIAPSTQSAEQTACNSQRGPCGAGETEMQPVTENGSTPAASQQAASVSPANGKAEVSGQPATASAAKSPAGKGKRREQGPQRQLPSRSGRPQGPMKDQPNIVQQPTPTAVPSSARGRGPARGRGRGRGAGPRVSLHGALAQVMHCNAGRPRLPRSCPSWQSCRQCRPALGICWTLLCHCLIAAFVCQEHAQVH